MPASMVRFSLLVAACAVALAGCSAQSSTGGGFSFLGQPDSAAAPEDIAGGKPDVIAPTDTPVAAPDSSGGYNPCVSCVAEDECQTGQHCAQILGSSYCAIDCAAGPSCADGFACAASSDTAGQQIQVCIPVVETACGGTPVDGPDAVSTPPDASGGSCPGWDDPGTPSCCQCAPGKTCDPNGCFGGWLCNKKTCKCNSLPVQCGGVPYDAGSTTTPDVVATVDAGPGSCGSLDGPTQASCCKCKGTNCALNGCYGGWYCNHDACKCQAAPDPSTCGGGAPDVISSPDVPVVQDVAKSDTGGGTVVTQSGGTLDSLDFAIVGDTRPPAKDDLANYPTAVITKIWQDVEAEAPSVPFAVTTGDYQFSTPYKTTAGPQLDLYLGARKNYSGMVYYTLGNHECTGATASNCGAGNTNGITTTYTTFLQKMLAPLGQTKPYYTIGFDAKDGSWNAKFVFVAANAWDATQAAWLDQQMAQPTTYTFVVRHEGDYTLDAPGVTPSGAIIAKYPYTLLLAGHTHTFEYVSSKRQVITGNGGAPLATAINYGYVVARQRPDKALAFTVYDYATHAVISKFAVTPTGNKTL